MWKLNWLAFALACTILAIYHLDAQSLPTPDLPPGTMQSKATTACTECHESRIIVQQRLAKAAWMKEVDKMMKWGATVDPQDRDALIEYLSVNFGPDRPPYVADRLTSLRQAKK
jgi:hypothetical protein